jgi:hypothetical protein
MEKAHNQQPAVVSLFLIRSVDYRNGLWLFFSNCKLFDRVGRSLLGPGKLTRSPMTAGLKLGADVFAWPDDEGRRASAVIAFWPLLFAHF